MSYYSDIFDRLDIQHIREFLLQGTEAVKIKQEGYKERIDKYKIAASDLIGLALFTFVCLDLIFPNRVSSLEGFLCVGLMKPHSYSLRVAIICIHTSSSNTR